MPCHVHSTDNHALPNGRHLLHHLPAGTVRVRVDGKAPQKTLLNLGRHFFIPREQWPELAQRAEALRSDGTEMSFAEPDDPALERTAEEIADWLRACESAAVEESPK